MLSVLRTISALLSAVVLFGLANGLFFTIFEGHHVIVFVNDVCRDVARGDLAEQAVVGHVRFLSSAAYSRNLSTRAPAPPSFSTSAS